METPSVPPRRNDTTAATGARLSGQFSSITQEWRSRADLNEVIEIYGHDQTGSSLRDRYLRASEAAIILHVSPKTVSRWAREGKLGHVVTLGGHRRFYREEIERLATPAKAPSELIGHGHSAA
jgi:excisionase family DNA binding protein